MSARAELLEDRGEAVVSAQFFRSRPFLDAEGVTHTLRITAAFDAEPVELLAPLVVSEIDGGPERDAVSPYAYPGLAVRASEGDSSRIAGRTDVSPGISLDPTDIDFSPTGLVSVFIRHRLGPLPLSGTTGRNVVQIADPALPAKSRPSDRRQVRRNLEAGYELTLVTGPETSPEQRAGFLDLYEQTMRRAGAGDHYFFGAAYFDRVLEADSSLLVLARAPGGELAAASMATVSDGYLHYYLSGSADSHLRDSPMKNVVARLIEHSAELALPLNLGGGITAGDALEEFKRGFGNRQETWQTSELVCDPTAYDRLSGGRDAKGFFPAYRA